MEGHGSQGSGAPGRRGFIEVLLGGGLLGLLGAMLYSVGRFVIPPKVADAGLSSVVAGKVKDFGSNSGKIFRFGNRPGILVRTPSGDFRAFSAVCTHLNCTVQYRSDLEKIWCACHNGTFDLYGKNVSGPPPRPLDAFDTAVRGDDIIVSRKA
ncbi:MAG TPA: Rieske (2Fe-2S) protein [Candidatus Sulfotelmatobacter sp.]|nr:Rieske (2Fe-2S) protein [Candidatus Sulfotelmatobacter sp.]